MPCSWWPSCWTSRWSGWSCSPPPPPPPPPLLYQLLDPSHLQRKGSVPIVQNKKNELLMLLIIFIIFIHRAIQCSNTLCLKLCEICTNIHKNICINCSSINFPFLFYSAALCVEGKCVLIEIQLLNEKGIKRPTVKLCMKEL